MKNIYKTCLLFLFGCILVRSLLVYLVKYRVSENHLPMLGGAALVLVLAWSYIYLSGSRTTGVETFGEPIWWNNLRPIHIGLFFMFALMALHKSNMAWMPLAVDVILGLTAFILHHFILN